MFHAPTKTRSTALTSGVCIAALGVMISAIGLGTTPSHAQQFGNRDGGRPGGTFQLLLGNGNVQFGLQFGRSDRGRNRTRGQGLERHRSGPQPDYFGETGVTTSAQQNRRQWHTVRLNRSYQNPVIIMGPLSDDGGDPATIAVRQSGPRSFQYQINEWAYLDGRHARATIGYMVVEAGQHRLAGGGTLVAGQTSGIDDDWSRVRFGARFETSPIVFTTMVSGRIGRTNGPSARNGPTPMVTRAKNVNRRGFDLRLQKEEAAPQSVRRARQVAWIAIEPGTGGRRGLAYIADRTGRTVTEDMHRITLPRDQQRLLAQPVFLAAMQSFNGRDSAALRYTPRRRVIALRVEEEQSQDSEVTHAAENIGYAIFAPGLLEAASPRGFRPGPGAGPNPRPRLTPPPTPVASVNGLTGEIYRAGGHIRNVGQVVAIMQQRPAAASFIATNINYNEGGRRPVAEYLRGDGASLSGNGRMQVEEMAFRFTGYILLEAGTHEFMVTSDDGFRLIIGGRQVTAHLNRRASAESRGSITIRQPGLYPIEIVHFDNHNGAVLQFKSSLDGGGIVSPDRLFTTPPYGAIDRGSHYDVSDLLLVGRDDGGGRRGGRGRR